MLTLNFIRENSQLVIDKLNIKNFKAGEIVNNIIDLDQKRRELQKQHDSLQSDLNRISKEIGRLYKEGQIAEAESLKEKTLTLKEEIDRYKDKLKEVEEKLNQLIIQLPNLPHDSVPPGKDSSDNLVVRSGGNIPNLSPENSLPHWDLAKKYNLIDFELGTKLTGSGFPVFLGKGALLQRALINFFLEENIKAGYLEYLPPLMVNEDSAFGTGQLPDKEGQMYYVPLDNFYLIPTAEVPVTNIYRDVILEEKDLPIKMTAYTPCFRREAGSYGKDVRGLNRVHQFDKVEIVRIEHPENSYQALEEMVNHVEGLVKKLELPYRIVLLCGGDMSFTSAKTYDFEVYSAAQQKWLEVSSVSNFESFQANRLKLRFREEKTKKIQLAHTLNGSSLALPRIVAALLENNQTKDGIILPDCLVKYTGFKVIS